MPGQRRGVTYVSRLQSIQAAIDDQLEVRIRPACQKTKHMPTLMSSTVLSVCDALTIVDVAQAFRNRFSSRSSKCFDYGFQTVFTRFQSQCFYVSPHG